MSAALQESFLSELPENGEDSRRQAAYRASTETSRPPKLSAEEADYLLAIGPYKARLAAQKKLLAYALSITVSEGESGPNLPAYVVEDLQSAVNLKKAELATFHAKYVQHMHMPRPLETVAVPTSESFEEAEEVELIEVDTWDDWRGVDTDIVKQYLREAGRTPLLKAEEEVQLSQAIEAGVLALGAQEGTFLYAGEATHDELSVLVQEGFAAKERLIAANLRLVISIAVRYQGRGLDLLDLIQEGNTGLLRAVEKFDYQKGYKFSTYATWWIRQAITRGVADKSQAIRVPVHMNERLTKLARAERELMDTTGAEPSIEELAHKLKTSPAKIKSMRSIRHRMLSLQTPIGEVGDAELGDFIESVDETDVADIVHAGTIHDSIGRVLGTLTEREYHVVASRLGLIDGSVKTLSEIGDELGLSKERVRQIEAKTMSKLRHPSRAHVLRELLG